MALDKVDVPPDGLWNEKPWKWQGISNIKGGQPTSEALSIPGKVGWQRGPFVENNRIESFAEKTISSSVMQPVELTRKPCSPLLMQRLLALCATPNLVGEKSAKIRNSSSPKQSQAVPSSPNRSQSVPSPNLSQSAPEISLPRSRGWPTDVHQTLGTAVASQRSYETTAPLIHSLSWIPRYRQCWECCWIAGFCFATWIILRMGHHQVCTCLSFAKMVVHPNHPFLIRCSKLDFPICYIFQSWINYLQDHRFMVDALKVWQLVDSKLKWPTATLTMCWSMLILGMGSQLFGPLNLKVFPDWIDQVFP